MDRDVTVYQCQFQLYVEKAIISIKFPCIFFLQWKTANGKKTAEGKSRPTSVNTLVTFQQTLQITSQLIFDNKSKQFTKKETIVNVNLVSKSRQDQSKLVGRVVVDLSLIANQRQFNELKNYQLAYCSVAGEIFFSVVMKNKRKTNLGPQDLDKSSFNEYVSFYTGHNLMLKTKKDDRESNEQQTSIGYGQKINQNVIDSHNNEIKINPKHQKKFYVLQSPKQNSSYNFINQNNNALKQRSIGTQTALTSLHKQFSTANQMNNDFGRQTFLLKNLDSDRDLKNVNKFRDEIDYNKQKIGQMQKKIMQLYSNLEDSKRHIEFAERQNRQKQEIIKKIKDSAKGHNQSEGNQWRQKFYILQKETSQAISKYKYNEDALKKQIQQNQLNFLNLRRQTQQLRRIWTQKREHYDQKLRKTEEILREKQNRINDLYKKNEQMTKSKYQNQMLKALNMQKQSKIKLLQRDLNRSSEQYTQLKINNLSQQNYKLQNKQLVNKIESINKQLQKYQAQVQKYRQNYIKIQTAYQIQAKSYENSKQKYNTLQKNVFSLQKENIQLKNSSQNINQVNKQTEKKYLQAYTNWKKIQSESQEIMRQILNLKIFNQNIKNDRDNLSSLVEKQKIEENIRKQDFQKELKRVQNSFLSSLQYKQNTYNLAKKQLQKSIAELQQSMTRQQKEYNIKWQNKQLQLAQTHQQLILLREEISTNVNHIKTLQQTIKDKQQIIKLSKQEIQYLKSTNNDLIDSLTKMRQTQKQLQENIVILEQQSQKIIYILQQKEQTDREFEHLKQKHNQLTVQKLQFVDNLKQLQSSYQNQKLKNLQFLRTIQQKQEEIKAFILKIQDINNQNSTFRDEWLGSKIQVDRLKSIFKEINERYEEHIKLEQRYLQQINLIRQQKQQIEVLMNKNCNQLVSHNQQLQNRITQLENSLEKFESCVQNQGDQRIQLQNVIKNNNMLQSQLIVRENQLRVKVQFLQSEIQKNKDIKTSLQEQIQRLNSRLRQQQAKFSFLQQKNLTISQKTDQADIKLKIFEEKIIFYENCLQKKDRNILQQQKKNNLLQYQVHNLQEKYNQQLIITQQKQPQFKSLFEGQQQFSQKEQQLQQLLFQSDRKNESLKQKLLQIQAELQFSKNFKSTENQQIYQSFNQFQREQMTKIIEEQRQQIDRIQSQLKNINNKDSSALQKKIQQLQTHIVQLESSFKFQLDRILGEQINKQTFNTANGGLSIINEQCSEQDMIKSQRSLFGSPNRVKSSFQLVQIYELREKMQIIQQQKQHLQQQFYLIEQQKFNLFSTINEKEIKIEQMAQFNASLTMEIDQLRKDLQEKKQRYKYIEYQTESLKNQLTFGSTLNFNINQHSITRSEPILNNEDHQYSNKNVYIENLKAQIQKQKNRQQELMWNIKDLEMQLETVSENLNLLNGSKMNSVLNGSGKKINSDDQKQEQKQKRQDGNQGYSKQKLLLELKKNEQLKQLAHNLIRVLKQRQKNVKQQQKVNKKLKNTTSQNQRLEAINQKIAKLLSEFQTIKVYVMKSESGKLKQEASRLLGQMKNVQIMKNIILFEEQLKSVRCINQPKSQIKKL